MPSLGFLCQHVKASAARMNQCCQTHNIDYHSPLKIIESSYCSGKTRLISFRYFLLSSCKVLLKISSGWVQQSHWDLHLIYFPRMYQNIKEIWENNLFLFFHRRKNQLEVSEDHVRVDLALQRDLGHVPCSGMGTLWPRAFRHILLSGLGANEEWGILFCHCHVLLQPRLTCSHHHLLLLWHRHQPLLYLQKGG